MDYDAINLNRHHRRGYLHQNGSRYHQQPYYGDGYDVCQEEHCNHVHHNRHILGNGRVHPRDTPGRVWDHPGRHSYREGLPYHYPSYEEDEWPGYQHYGYRHQHIQPIVHERPLPHYDYYDPRMLPPANGYYPQRPMPVVDDVTHFFSDENARGCSIM